MNREKALVVMGLIFATALLSFNNSGSQPEKLFYSASEAIYISEEPSAQEVDLSSNSSGESTTSNEVGLITCASYMGQSPALQIQDYWENAGKEVKLLWPDECKTDDVLNYLNNDFDNAIDDSDDTQESASNEEFAITENVGTYASMVVSGLIEESDSSSSSSNVESTTSNTYAQGTTTTSSSQASSCKVLVYWTNIGHSTTTGQDGAPCYGLRRDVSVETPPPTVEYLNYTQMYNKEGITDSIVFINSCNSYMNPWRSAVTSNNPAHYIGGRILLPIHESNGACEDFWYYYIVVGKDIKNALIQAFEDNYHYDGSPYTFYNWDDVYGLWP